MKIHIYKQKYKIINFFRKVGNFWAKDAYTYIKEWAREVQELPKINVSFKQTTKDMTLYTAVIAQEEKSEFVKRAIEHYLKYLEKES